MRRGRGFKGTTPASRGGIISTNAVGEVTETREEGTGAGGLPERVRGIRVLLIFN